MWCRRCGQREAIPPRGLCGPCSGRPGSGVGRAPLPETPTDAPAGSEEKVTVLERRAALRQELFHPRDSRERLPAPKHKDTPRPFPSEGGVVPDHGRWLARFSFRGVGVFVGRFASREAALVALEAARRRVPPAAAEPVGA